MALGLLASWLRWFPVLRGCPFVVRLTAAAWPIGRAFPTASDPVAAPWKLKPASRFSLLGLGVLVISSAALPALAYASPPDPLWIPGIYDDADYDDVVTLATSGPGDVAPALPADVPARPPLVGSVPRLAQTEPHGPGPSAVRSRAPPPS
jgi:hypothetical protein